MSDDIAKARPGELVSDDYAQDLRAQLQVALFEAASLSAQLIEAEEQRDTATASASSLRTALEGAATALEHVSERRHDRCALDRCGVIDRALAAIRAALNADGGEGR